MGMISPDKTQPREELPKFSFLMNKSDDSNKFLSPAAVKTRSPAPSYRTPVLSKANKPGESPLTQTGSSGKRLGGR